MHRFHCLRFPFRGFVHRLHNIGACVFVCFEASFFTLVSRDDPDLSISGATPSRTPGAGEMRPKLRRMGIRCLPTCSAFDSKERDKSNYGTTEADKSKWVRFLGRNQTPKLVVFLWFHFKTTKKGGPQKKIHTNNYATCLMING